MRAAQALRSRIGLPTSPDRGGTWQRATLTAGRLGAGASVAERPAAGAADSPEIGDVVLCGRSRTAPSPLVLPAGPVSMVGARHPRPSSCRGGGRIRSAQTGDANAWSSLGPVPDHLIFDPVGPHGGVEGRPDRGTLTLPEPSWTASGAAHPDLSMAAGGGFRRAHREAVNGGRKRTTWRRVNTDHPGRHGSRHGSSVVAAGTRPRSRSLSR
jgi:hypothetical protein